MSHVGHTNSDATRSIMPVWRIRECWFAMICLFISVGADSVRIMNLSEQDALLQSNCHFHKSNASASTNTNARAHANNIYTNTNTSHTSTSTNATENSSGSLEHATMQVITMNPHIQRSKPASETTSTAPAFALASPSAPRSSASPSSSAAMHPRDEMLCRYPSKLCDNTRSEKRGGGLHRFCAYHRERANINQRRVDHRRRMRRRRAQVARMDQPYDRHAGSSEDDNEMLNDMVSLDLDAFPVAPEAWEQDLPLSTLSESDLQELLNVLNGVEDSEPLDGHAAQGTDSALRTIKEEPRWHQQDNDEATL